MLSVGLLILRLAFGLTMAAHGAQKAFGWFDGPGLKGSRVMVERMGFRPVTLWTIALSASELGGGILVAIGLLTPIAALIVVGAMITAIVTVHLDKGFFAGKGGIEHPMVIGAAMLSLAFTGPGAASLDHLLGLQLNQPATVLGLLAIVVVGTLAGLASRRFGGGAVRDARQAA
jgi:putative oxidoreductase